MRRLTYAEVRQQWREFNHQVFDSKLRPPPRFYICYNKNDDHLGWVWTSNNSPRIRGIGLNLAAEGGTYWKDTLLHEMVHQYEYEILRKRGREFESHKSFDTWQDRIQMLGLPYSILTVEGHEILA